MMKLGTVTVRLSAISSLVSSGLYVSGLVYDNPAATIMGFVLIALNSLCYFMIKSMME